MKKVIISIKGGNIKADFLGFQGKACETLEQRLRPEGLELQEVETKPEYGFQTASEQTETASY